MKRIVLLISLLAIVLSVTVNANASEITIRGKLQKTAEAGGWVIASEKEKYLLLNANVFQKESWFKEVMTTYMEGKPFEAKSLRPVNQSSASVTSDEKRLTRVLVNGDSIVQAQPDTAIVTVSCVTQGKRAIDAKQENATKSDAVVRALKAAAGPGAEVKTSGYSLQPQRIYKEGQPPTITGYEARNSVTVTLSDLTKLGPVIDATSLAGANDLGGISFTLRQDRPARDRALTEATLEAMSKAKGIAQALGGRVIRIVEVQEGGYIRPPQPMYQAEAMMVKRDGVSTPIEVGSLDIHSSVQLVAEIEANM